MKEEHLINNLNTDDFALACVGCGSQTILSMYAHRNQYNTVTGFVIVCGMCVPKMSRMRITIDVQEE